MLSYISWGSVADWFGSFGTIGAVIVSLYLARKRPKPDLEAKFNEQVAVFDGINAKNLMSWDIKNYSDIPTKITLVGAIVSVNKKVKVKSKNKNVLLLKPRDIFRTHKMPICIEAYGVESILFEFEGIQEILEKKEWQSLVFFCKDNFGKEYYSKNFQTNSLLVQMKKYTEYNKKLSA